jgi:putative FmdB family regulatory protein
MMNKRVLAGGGPHADPRGAAGAPGGHACGVALYDYACRACGVVERSLPIGAAPSSLPCPQCGAPARRVFTPPAIGATDTPLRRAHEAAARSADEPAVVRGPPPRPPPRRSANPLHARLPRP